MASAVDSQIMPEECFRCAEIDIFVLGTKLGRQA